MSDELPPGTGEPQYGSQHSDPNGPPQPPYQPQHTNPPHQPYPAQPPYSTHQPPAQPPYPPQLSPPFAPRPPRSARSGATIAAALLSVAFIAATVIVAYVAHHPATSSTARASAVDPGGVAVAGGASLPATSRSDTSLPDTEVPVAPAPVTSSTSTVPSVPQLDPEAINRTFEGYMNALVDHDLAALHSATCPRLRSTEVGFALHGNYVHSWRGQPYEIPLDATYVTVSAVVKLRSPSTGASGGSATYGWYVERSGGHYYVCGFLS